MAITSAIAAAVGTGYSIYTGEKARKSNKTATTQARADAQAAATQADRDFNKLNPKTPNIAALLKRNKDLGSRGVGGTYLTGPSGAPVGSGMLGGNTLLGR